MNEISPLTRADLAALPLLADTQFCELMGSESFNRKLLGIVPKGIYRGFEHSIAGADTLRICPQNPNSAAIERDGQLITVQGQHPIDVVIPRNQDSAVVIEAISAHDVLTSQVDKNSAVKAAEVKVIPFDAVQPHHVIILRVNLPTGQVLNGGHISTASRTVGGLLNVPTIDMVQALFQPKGDYITIDQAKSDIVAASGVELTEPSSLKIGERYVFPVTATHTLPDVTKLPAGASKILYFKRVSGAQPIVKVHGDKGEKLVTSRGAGTSLKISTNRTLSAYFNGVNWEIN
jgi:hypothetical protein